MNAVIPLSQPSESRLMRIVRDKWTNVGIAGLPWVGGPLQAYLAGVVSEIDKQTWDSYWRSVEQKLEQLDASKIDAGYFSSEDFVRRLRRVYAEVTSGADDVKLSYLRDYFVACALTSVDVTARDLFFSQLREMTGAHLLVLRFVYEKQKSLSYKDRFELPQRVDGSPISIADILPEIPGIDAVLGEMLVYDLCSRGLMGQWLGVPSEPKGWSITGSGVALMLFLCSVWLPESSEPEDRTRRSTE